MRFAVISVTAKGADISKVIACELSKRHDVTRYAFENYPSENAVIFSDLQLVVNEIFYVCDGLIFVCACGIAIRKIAPLLRSKLTDPAVVVVDESAQFAVSLLSGHIGGANALAQCISEIIGAIPVITTATDTGGKFSPDSFAKANNLHICNMKDAKKLAAAVLSGEKIGLESDYQCQNIPSEFTHSCNAEYGICISENTEKKPFKNTLNLVPKNISVGFGCRKNTDYDIFERFIMKMLEKNHIKLSSISFAATIDLKKNEMAILRFCRKYSISLRFYTAVQLMSIGGNFSTSEFVMKTTGADNVCERSAAIDGGKIIVPKCSESAMTFAAALNEIFIDFERRII